MDLTSVGDDDLMNNISIRCAGRTRGGPCRRMWNRFATCQTRERVERVGDRLVAGIVAAAFIRGVGELASADKERWGRWEGPLMGIGLGMGGALGAYLGWTARRLKRRPRR